MAAISLGQALEISNGHLHPVALLALSVAFGMSIVGLVVPRHQQIEHAAAELIMPLLIAGILVQALQLATSSPGIYLRDTDSQLMTTFTAALFALMLSSLLGLWNVSLLTRVWMPLILVIHFIMDVWIIQHAPDPFIDVYVFQQDSVAAVLSGENPYSQTFPDIYGPGSGHYGPGVAADGRVLFGFPYPPLKRSLHSYRFTI